MNNSLLSLYDVSGATLRDQQGPFAALPTREAALKALSDNPNFDLLILGGGLTGALVAHQAALQDIKVLLVGSDCFGARSISWCHRIAKMLREHPMKTLRNYRALRKVERNASLSHLTLKLQTDSQPLSGFWTSLIARVTPQFDIDERLLIREALLAAKQEGATVLSAIEPTFLEAEALSGCYSIGCRDTLSGEIFQARVGGVLVDPTVGQLPLTRLGTSVLRVADPSTGGIQRVYEVTPFTAKSGELFTSFALTDGSFVSVSRLGHDLVEVTVLYGDVALDTLVVDGICEEACREAGWKMERVLSSRSVDGRWRSSYEVRQERGIFTFSHRGPWDAFTSAESVVRSLLSLRDTVGRQRKLPLRAFPGAEQAREVDVFRAAARGQGVPESTIERCVARWRGRVRYLGQFSDGFREVFPGMLSGEIDLAYISDHSRTAEDIAMGALRLDRSRNWHEALPLIQKRLVELNAKELG
jgi:hypothetical protein